MEPPASIRWMRYVRPRPQAKPRPTSQPTSFCSLIPNRRRTTNLFFSHPVGAESRAHGVFLSLLLQPLGHQVPFIFLETGGAIQRLRALVFPSHLKAHRLDAGFPAQIFRKDDYGPAQLLPAVRFAEIEFIEQGKASMKFQAEAKREREISSQFRAAKDEIDLRQIGIIQHAVYCKGRCWFVELDVLLRVKFAH